MGGGPITIGAVDYGSMPIEKMAIECALKIYLEIIGSASLAVELTRNAERSSAGSNIIVAEWGERRIVCVEGSTGARTPLVTLVPNPSDTDVSSGG